MPAVSIAAACEGKVVCVVSCSPVLRRCNWEADVFVKQNASLACGMFLIMMCASYSLMRNVGFFFTPDPQRLVVRQLGFTLQSITWWVKCLALRFRHFLSTLTVCK